MFHYHAEHEDAYVDTRPRADVMLLKAGVNQNEYKGWFRVLVENHILFNVVRADAAPDVEWDGYTTVIVPGMDTMSDALAEKLDRFATDGGTLIVTGQSGFRDEFRHPRAEPALKSLGIEEVLEIRDAMRSSYFKMTDKRGFDHFENTDLVYMNGFYVYARYDETADGRLQLIPPHNFGPPERTYYELVVDHPGVIVHPTGLGRVIYVPWLPGTLFHRQGHLNTAWFCADLLMGDESAGFAGIEPVGGNLSPQVEVGLLASEDGDYHLLHLVNTSGHFGNSFYPPVTMTDLKVSVSYPAVPSSVEGLRSGERLDYHFDAGHLTIHVPSLGLFEAIKITI